MIANLNVVKHIDDTAPKGLNNIDIENIHKITNNYVNHIDCLCLDDLTFDQRNHLFVTMINKLCLGGTISIKFINLSLLASKIEKLEITGEKFSKIFQNIFSAWSEPEYLDIINQMKLKVNNIYFDQIYTIATLEKTI
jgi:hypothetical protein